MYRRCWFRFVAVLACLANGAFADSLQWMSTPPVVRFGSEIQVALQYQADPSAFPKSVLAGIAPAGTMNQWIGVTRIGVNPGNGTLNLTFKLDVAPADLNRPFVFTAYLVEEGGGSWQITAVAPLMPVIVKADRLWLTSAPRQVENGLTVPLRFQYVIESNGYLKADLLKPGAPLGSDWFGGASIPLIAGTGSVALAVAVEGFPPAGPDYQWSAFIGSSTNFASATATAQDGPVRVIADALSIVSSPAIVSPNQTVSLELDYMVQPSDEGKYLKVNLLYPQGGYAYFGGTNVALPEGAGRTTVQFRVEGNSPVSSTNYVFDAFIARNGQDFDKATARDQASVEMRADSISFNSYPDNIWTPNTWSVRVNYSVWSQRIVQVNLLTPTYVYRASGVVTVQTGSGVANVSVQVPNTFPSGWHIWSTFTAPVGGGWSDHTADAASDPIWVTLDPVKIVSAPTNVQRGATVDVTLSWEVLQDSEVHIDLVEDGTFTWYGGAWTTIAAGTGTSVFSVAINPATPMGTNYLWSSWVGPVGQGYANRTADEVIKNITVRP
jgi:hypothetical protein